MHARARVRVCVCVCVCVCEREREREREKCPGGAWQGEEVRPCSLSKAHGQVLRCGSLLQASEPELLVFRGGDYRA